MRNALDDPKPQVVYARALALLGAFPDTAPTLFNLACSCSRRIQLQDTAPDRRECAEIGLEYLQAALLLDPGLAAGCHTHPPLKALKDFNTKAFEEAAGAPAAPLPSDQELGKD